MIRRRGERAVRDDRARRDPADVGGGHEEVVEAEVWIPGRKGVAGLGGVVMTERVGVAGVEDGLDRPPANPAAAQPDERPETRRQLAHVQSLAWRKRVEVADQRVKATLALPQGPEQGAQLEA